jgi:hypothetical protein
MENNQTQQQTPVAPRAKRKPKAITVETPVEMFIKDTPSKTPVIRNMPETPKSKNSFSWVKIGIFALIIIGAGTYGFQKFKASGNPNLAAAEVKGLVASVGQLMLVPTDEQPTVATVTDPAKLASQEFFAHAQAGDKVLMYAKARKAILYSPKQNKIIEVATLNTQK